MRFSLQEFIEFDISFINSKDLPTVFRMQTEWFNKHCPIVTLKELARVGNTTTPINRDKVWNEPTSGKISFDRIFPIRAHVELQTDDIKHTKTGISRKSGDSWWFGLEILQRADWMPSIGDHIVRSKITYEITEVYVDPEHYWTHTNVPTMITCKTIRYQFGSNELPNTLLANSV